MACNMNPSQGFIALVRGFGISIVELPDDSPLLVQAYSLAFDSVKYLPLCISSDCIDTVVTDNLAMHFLLLQGGSPTLDKAQVSLGLLNSANLSSATDKSTSVSRDYGNLPRDGYLENGLSKTPYGQVVLTFYPRIHAI